MLQQRSAVLFQRCAFSTATACRSSSSRYRRVARSASSRCGPSATVSATCCRAYRPRTRASTASPSTPQVSLLQGIQTEDQGVDRVAVYAAGELAAEHTDRGPGRRPRRRLRRRSAACNSQSDDWRELLNCRVLLPLQLQCRPYAVYYLSQYYY